MSFRKKLIILLVCLSILPILALRAFGIHNVHLFADEVIRQVNLNSQKSNDLRFNAVAQHHQKRISQTFEKLESALLFQTYEARRLLREVNQCQPFDPVAAAPPLSPPALAEHTPEAPTPGIWSTAVRAFRQVLPTSFWSVLNPFCRFIAPSRITWGPSFCAIIR